jgi:CheY-like chemotaxis protein
MRRILIVDDDLHTRLAIRTWLKQCGFRIAIADGGVSGLAALDDSTFDLMMVDIFMPQPLPRSRPHCPNRRAQRHHEFFEGEALTEGSNRKVSRRVSRRSRAPCRRSPSGPRGQIRKWRQTGSH